MPGQPPVKPKALQHVASRLLNAPYSDVFFGHVANYSSTARQASINLNAEGCGAEGTPNLLPLTVRICPSAKSVIGCRECDRCSGAFPHLAARISDMELLLPKRGLPLFRFIFYRSMDARHPCISPQFLKLHNRCRFAEEKLLLATFRKYLAFHVFLANAQATFFHFLGYAMAFTGKFT